jgi:hypothetical protein
MHRDRHPHVWRSGWRNYRESMEIYGCIWIKSIPKTFCPKDISGDLRILMGYKGIYRDIKGYIGV